MSSKLGTISAAGSELSVWHSDGGVELLVAGKVFVAGKDIGFRLTPDAARGLAALLVACANKHEAHVRRKLKEKK